VPTDPQAPAKLIAPAKVSSGDDGISLLASLLSSINSKAVPKRALFSNLPLELAPGLKISVKGYIIYKREEVHRTSYIWLGGENPQIAKLSRSQMADDTGKEVDKREIRKAYKFGGEQISFTPAEIGHLRHFGDPIIRIIGYKPMNQETLPQWANVGKSIFVYPSEDGYVGSTRTFSALHQVLLKKEMLGIAWYIARKNATPVLVALVPGAEELDDEGQQQMPAGMWLVPLPYADDIRANPSTEVITARDELVDTMRVVMQQLQLPLGVYDPSKYPNPGMCHLLCLLPLVLLSGHPFC
jgi:ATP-dependent DNA helicase 2 subunit 1